MRPATRFLSLLLAVAAGFWAWNSGPLRLRERLFPRRFAEVEPGLYRSGQIDARLIDGVLRKHDIRLIVDLQGLEDGSRDRDAEARAVGTLGLRHEDFPLTGRGLGSLEEYAGAVTAIKVARDAGQSVLVHCAAGARRTGGVLAAYELLVKGDPLKAELELERYTGPGDESSTLRAFLNDNRVALADELARRGVIPGVPASVPPLVDTAHG